MLTVLAIERRLSETLKSGVLQKLRVKEKCFSNSSGQDHLVSLDFKYVFF